jgi:hypothetical protein
LEVQYRVKVENVKEEERKKKKKICACGIIDEVGMCSPKGKPKVLHNY